MTVGTGAGLDATDMVLNIGPQHPSTHGVLRLRLVLDGERIVAAEPIIGYMHRGAEKLFEVRDYRQIIVLANRHDWLSAFSNELGVVLAVERMMGMEVPERAVWLRTALAELNRVLNHLMFLGSYPLEIGAITPVFYAFRERETMQAVMEEAPAAACTTCSTASAASRRRCRTAGPAGLAPPSRGPARLPELENLIRGNEIFLARTVGVGVLSGRARPLRTAPPARSPAPPASTSTCAATSHTWRTASSDVPRRDPYGQGDCHARFEVLLDQVYVSLDLAERVPRRVERLRGPGQPAAAEGGQGPGGSHLRLDREPARHQRLLPGVAGREDAVAAEAAHRLVRQRAGAVAVLPGSLVPTWSRSWGRCSSSSATSTSRSPVFGRAGSAAGRGACARPGRAGRGGAA